MKNKKTQTAKKTYLKGHEPRTVHLKNLKKEFTTNGLTKKEWKTLKEPLKPLSPEDKKTAKDVLSI
jgi:hypothetical protein